VDVNGAVVLQIVLKMQKYQLAEQIKLTILLAKSPI
jgi:hypothetical protein